MKEKTLYYAVLQNGQVDVSENIDGKDLGNYCFANMTSVEREYPKNEWNYVDMNEVIERDGCSVEEKTNLKKFREQAGLTQQQLANTTGVNIRMIQDYEQKHKDINNARAITLLKLASTLNCSIEDLME